MKFSLSAAGLDALSRGMAEAPEMTNRVLLSTMMVVTQGIQGEVQDAMPRGATGLTAQSIASDAFVTPAGVLGVVGSSQPSALFVEEGTKPHMPPVAALVPWVQQVLGISAPQQARSVAFLIARKIAAKGTKAKRPFANTIERLMPQVVREFEAAAARVASHLAGQGGVV